MIQRTAKERRVIYRKAWDAAKRVQERGETVTSISVYDEMMKFENDLGVEVSLNSIRQLLKFCFWADATGWATVGDTPSVIRTYAVVE
jgi:hypothetical protein